ncbi:hypothetical protein Enr13x_57160 [Stieleria neptunia]|uniref:Uncharacterized protein n=1 Tax=Stieleria neptunia TaxID=2527979 RepID=A0A518HY74_9BACT|nr:hypothetical protein [Stieleria neptunia]QDV45813.1 hypothetical protein Enr13x_57160 [Stieleria neptunia]
MHVRRFNPSGIEAFRKFLRTCRDAPSTPTPWELLESDEFTSLTTETIEIDSRSFDSRREAAEYLHAKLGIIRAESLRYDAGLWTWLSLFYFDQICPAVAGNRKVRNDYTYIYMPRESRYFYRHLLFVSWYVQHIAPSHNRLLLDGPVSQLDRFTAEVIKRLYLTRIPAVFEVLDRVYWDESTKRAFSGVTSPGKVKAGDLLHRFPIRIRQLEKTYDLQSLTADQLIELLGSEFQQIR